MLWQNWSNNKSDTQKSVRPAGWLALLKAKIPPSCSALELLNQRFPGLAVMPQRCHSHGKFDGRNKCVLWELAN